MATEYFIGAGFGMQQAVFTILSYGSPEDASTDLDNVRKDNPFFTGRFGIYRKSEDGEYVRVSSRGLVLPDFPERPPRPPLEEISTPPVPRIRESGFSDSMHSGEYSG